LEKKIQQLTSTTSTTTDLLGGNKFNWYSDVAIVTKVHWPNDLLMLQQMLCLFKAAYNRHLNYDIVVFTTIPWNETTTQQLADVVAPAHLEIVVDSAPLEDRLARLTGIQRRELFQRCDVKDNETLTWFHHCTEPTYGNKANLAYAWQSEFRARHLWTNPAMKKYRYMIWMDSDAMCTKDWNIDPMQMMVENELVLMYNNFPMGFTKNEKLRDKMMFAYNKTVCRVLLDEKEGYFNTYPCDDSFDGGVNDIQINQVHGFHHVTDLKFYRSQQNMKFFKTFIGNNQFSREWDDQIAVTVPAAVLAPEKAWEYKSHGINVSLIHNGDWDGNRMIKAKHWSYKRMWFEGGIMNSWPAGKELCRPYVKVRG